MYEGTEDRTEPPSPWRIVPSSLIILRIQSIGSGGSLTSFTNFINRHFWHSNEETGETRVDEYILQYETQGAGPNRLAPNGKRSERSTIREASPTLQKILRCPFSIFRIFIVVHLRTLESLLCANHINSRQ